MITPINHVLTEARKETESDSIINRELLSREQMVNCLAIEIFTLLLRPIHMILTGTGAVLKGFVKLIRIFAKDSEPLKNFDEQLPCVSCFFESIQKTGILIAALFCTLTTGIAHPPTNITLHEKLGVVAPKPVVKEIDTVKEEIEMTVFTPKEEVKEEPKVEKKKKKKKDSSKKSSSRRFKRISRSKSQAMSKQLSIVNDNVPAAAADK